MENLLSILFDMLINFVKFFVFGISFVVAIVVSYTYPVILIGALIFAAVASIVKCLKR